MKIQPSASLVVTSISAAALVGAVIAGCSTETNPSGGSEKQADAPAVPTGEQGVYMATLAAVNNAFPNVNGTFSANAAGDSITFRLTGRGLSQGQIVYPQIRTGDHCPTMANDTNRDGFIDAVEAREVVGDVLIPLDANPATQQDISASPSPSATPELPAEPADDSAGGNYPTVAYAFQASPSPSPTPRASGITTGIAADQNGVANYEASASLSAILSDLRRPDTNPSDDLAKLQSDQNLDLGNRVVVLLGAPQNFPLPGTVRGAPNTTPTASVMVACGVIRNMAAGPTPGPTVTPSVSPSPSATPTGR